MVASVETRFTDQVRRVPPESFTMRSKFRVPAVSNQAKISLSKKAKAITTTAALISAKRPARVFSAT
jgi:hypothetical protein